MDAHSSEEHGNAVCKRLEKDGKNIMAFRDVYIRRQDLLAGAVVRESMARSNPFTMSSFILVEKGREIVNNFYKAFYETVALLTEDPYEEVSSMMSRRDVLEELKCAEYCFHTGEYRTSLEILSNWELPPGAETYLMANPESELAQMIESLSCRVGIMAEVARECHGLTWPFENTPLNGRC